MKIHFEQDDEPVMNSLADRDQGETSVLIAVLEDDPRRLAAMRTATFGSKHCEVRFFDSSDDDRLARSQCRSG